MIEITGKYGFLMSNLIEGIIESDVNDVLLHFAFPSDSDDFKDTENMRNIMKYSMKLFDEAMEKGYKIIFASSEAVLHEDTWYSVNKKALEYYIKDYPNHLILRIPRVYGKDRNKGLIKKLKNGTFKGDKNQVLEYMDIDDWVKETLKILQYNNIYEYKNKRKETIKEIQEKYIGNKK